MSGLMISAIGDEGELTTEEAIVQASDQCDDVVTNDYGIDNFLCNTMFV